MTGARNIPMRHLAGLALVLGLLALCWGLWLWVPGWLRGTPLQEMPLLITFVVWILALSAADRLWGWLGGQDGNSGPTP